MSSPDCPVCGYKPLDETAEEALCPCCNNALTRGESSASTSELRRAWIDAGAPWLSTSTSPPADWSAFRQLHSAGHDREALRLVRKPAQDRKPTWHQPQGMRRQSNTIR